MPVNQRPQTVGTHRERAAQLLVDDTNAGLAKSGKKIGWLFVERKIVDANRELDASAEFTTVEHPGAGGFDQLDFRK